MRRFICKLAMIIFALAIITIGVGMFLHPIASESFYPGSKYSGPHMVHHSKGDMKSVGILFGLFGLFWIWGTFKSK
jgi:hypothetical protein